MRAILDAYAARVRERLEPTTFDAAWRSGQRMEGSQALLYAREGAAAAAAG